MRLVGRARHAGRGVGAGLYAEWALGARAGAVEDSFLYRHTSLLTLRRV